MSRTHLLFDLDQTLMASNSAGGAALRRACDDVPGADGAFAGLTYEGRTDLWIVRQVAEATGVDEAVLMKAFREDYPTFLREELRERDSHAPSPESPNCSTTWPHARMSSWASAPGTGGRPPS